VIAHAATGIPRLHGNATNLHVGDCPISDRPTLVDVCITAATNGDKKLAVDSLADRMVECPCLSADGLLSLTSDRAFRENRLHVVAKRPVRVEPDVLVVANHEF
jgi:hypothetical protein